MSVSLIDLLLHVPVDISYQVLGNWVGMRTIVRLCCAQGDERKVVEKDRVKTFIQSEHFVFHNYVELTQPMLNFLYHNRVKVSSLKIDAEFAPAEHFAKYLSEFGHFVRTMEITGSRQKGTTACIALYCKNLTYLRGRYMEVNSAFVDILRQNPNLLTLSLIRVIIADANILLGLHFKAMTKLVLIGCSCTAGMSWLRHFSADSLQCVGFCDSDISEEYLLIILQKCHHIQALGLQETNLTDELLQQVVELRPNIKHIDVSENKSLTDAGMHCLARNLTQLYFVGCQGCPGITNASLSYLAEHRGATLQVLYANIDSAGTQTDENATLQTFCQHATALHTIGLYAVDVNETAIARYIIEGCASLRMLIVTDEKWMCTGVRAILRHLRPELLVRENCCVADVTDMPV